MLQLNSPNFTRQRKADACPRCRKIVSLSNMARHISSCGIARCYISPQRKQNGLPPTSELVKHISQSNCGKWQCDKCTKVFQTKKSLAHHYWQIHPSLENETKKSPSNQFMSGLQTHHTAETRAKMSSIKQLCPSGVAADPSLRAYAGRSKHYEVIDSFGSSVILQSSWEYQVMLELNANNILWRRGQTFWLTLKSKNGNPSSYTPDFWLPDFDIYLDPKARDNVEQSVRITHWISQYSKKLLIIRHKHQLTWTYIESQISLL
jgi:hypothetical protein